MVSFTVRRGTNFKMGADLLIDTTNAPCSRVEERSAWGGMWIGAWGSCQWNKMVWLKCGEEWSRGVRCLSNYRYSEYTMHPPHLDMHTLTGLAASKWFKFFWKITETL